MLIPPQAVDGTRFLHHHSEVEIVNFSATDRRVRVVGGLGSSVDLEIACTCPMRDCCDLAEIRLDLLLAGAHEVKPTSWLGLAPLPLLFTARRHDEGGAGALDAEARMALLRLSMDSAACIDIELASREEMRPLLDELRERGIPWIASYHDFEKLPEWAVLTAAAETARKAGAAIFKIAALLHTPQDVARLADFQLLDHGLPVASMGMGRLAPVSRLLCAQAGSVLNYGYVGQTPTAPGQWDSAFLKQAISRLAPLVP